MKLIKPSFSILDQQSGLEGICKQIELCGRTCYRSQDKITEDSAKKFVDMLIKRGHTACLEQGTVYLHQHFKDGGRSASGEVYQHYLHNPYSKVIQIHDRETGGADYYITTNYRVLYENGWLKDIQYLCKPTKFHIPRITVKFICDRGVSHKRFVA